MSIPSRLAPRRAALILPALSLALCALAGPVQGRIIERVVAQVDDRIITLSELRDRLEPLLYELRGRFSGLELEEELAKARSSILDTMIDELLLEQEAERLGVHIDDAMVDAAIDDVRQRLDLPDLETLKEALEKEGLNYETYREHMRQQLAILRVVGMQVRSRIEILDADVAARYEAVKNDRYRREEKVALRQILFTLAEGSSDDEVRALLAKAEAVRDEFLRQSGPDESLADRTARFEELARKVSQGPAASSGGNIGELSRGQMIDVLEEAAFDTPEGGVSRPIRTEHGVHLFFVVKHSAASYVPLADVRDELRDELYEEAFRKEREAYIQRLRDRAYIEVLYTPGAAPEEGGAGT